MVIEHVNNEGSPGCAMAIDFEAAFGVVSLQFLLETLNCYNFGPHFAKMVKHILFEFKQPLLVSSLTEN